MSPKGPDRDPRHLSATDLMLNRVRTHFDRDIEYPLPRFSPRPVFDVGDGLYELQYRCSNCNHNVRQFFVVRPTKQNGQWATGITQEGMEWLCDQVDSWQMSTWPDDSKWPAGAVEVFIPKLPSNFFDTSFFKLPYKSFSERALGIRKSLLSL